jgi:alkylhydroperoxidase family enzyme
VLADWRAAPVNARVHAALAMLETMTLRPDELGTGSLRPLLDAGVSEEGVVDALYVGFLFNTIDRIADSLGFEVVSDERFSKGADRLLKHGYV